jgi:DNA-binding response OmpR family regulator
MAQTNRDTERSPQLRGSKNILVVEDEKGVRELLEDILYLEGYSPTGVGNGTDGISMFRKYGYDLVVSDLRLPGISGSYVAKAIKNVNPQTPIIIVTGWDTEPFIDELEEAGVDRVLHKPFNMEDIVSLVNELTGESPPPASTA